MNVCWIIHMYPPIHGAGSEMVAHAVNKYLISKGHKVRVLLMQAAMHKVQVPYEYEGVEVHGSPTHVDGYMWGDVFLTHLDFTQHAIQFGSICKKPVINFIHNSHPYQSIQGALSNNYCVYNSHWIKNELQYAHPSMVFEPPCDWMQYDTGVDPSKSEYITLINLDENKGGLILRRIAQAMPDRKFLAVRGAYSEPAEIGQVVEQPSNVTVIENSPDVANIYRQTRILLMLSRYESWGRTATEAMCNGIPVICTPTPGLKENCAEVGIYIPERGPINLDKKTGKVLSHDGDTYDIGPVIKAIKALDNKKEYARRSQLARDRSRDLDPRSKLAELEDFIINAARAYRMPSPHKMVYL